MATHVDDGVMHDNSDRYELSGSESQTIPMESGDEHQHGTSSNQAPNAQNNLSGTDNGEDDFNDNNLN